MRPGCRWEFGYLQDANIGDRCFCHAPDILRRRVKKLIEVGIDLADHQACVADRQIFRIALRRRPLLPGDGTNADGDDAQDAGGECQGDAELQTMRRRAVRWAADWLQRARV